MVAQQVPRNGLPVQRLLDLLRKAESKNRRRRKVSAKAGCRIGGGGDVRRRQRRSAHASHPTLHPAASSPRAGTCTAVGVSENWAHTVMEAPSARGSSAIFWTNPNAEKTMCSRSSVSVWLSSACARGRSVQAHSKTSQQRAQRRPASGSPACSQAAPLASVRAAPWRPQPLPAALTGMALTSACSTGDGFSLKLVVTFVSWLRPLSR